MWTTIFIHARMKRICIKLGGVILAEYHHDRNPYEYRNTQNEEQKARNTYATAALIGGIIAVLNLCCFSFTTAIVLGVGAVSFALISKNGKKISKPARIAVFLGVGSVVFGVIEYYYAIKLLEMVKAPENIAQFNQMYRELEKFLPK